MASTVGSLFSTESIRIEEIISKQVGIFLPSLDKVWEDSIVTNQGVGPVGDMGRDWEILKVYLGGLTGVIEPGGPGGDFTLYGDPSNSALGSKLFLQGLTRTFPDALNGPNQAPYRLGIPMRSMVTNLMITLGEMQAEATPAFIGEIINPKLKGFAHNIAQNLCNYWWTSQNGNFALSTLASSGTVSSGNVASQLAMSDGTSTTYKTITLDLTYSNYAINRFMVGMRVQFFNSAGTTQRTVLGSTSNSTFVVVAVDPLTCKVSFKEQNNAILQNNATIGSDTAFVGNLAASDIIVPAGIAGNANTPYAASSPYFTGIAGVNSWMKFGDTSGSTDTDANCLLGAERAGSGKNINVNVHPEFRSMKVDNGGLPMTEHRLRQILRRWHAAKEPLQRSIDCLVASDGVWLAYEGQKIGRQILDRTNRLSTINKEGSAGVMEIEFDGRSYEGYTSFYVEAQTIYGIKKGGSNWKRYVPPDQKGVKRGEKMDPWIPFRFAAPALTGTGSNGIPIFQVANNRTLVTEGIQMPGFLRMQLVPDQPDGIKISNVAEDRIYST